MSRRQVVCVGGQSLAIVAGPSCVPRAIAVQEFTLKPGEDTTSRPRLDDWSFLRRLALAAAVVVFLYVVWKVAPVLVLLFGALLISTLLRGATNAIERSLSISSRWSLAIVISAIALIVAAVTIVIGSQISGQVTNIFRQIPEALDAAGARIGISVQARDWKHL